MILYKKNKEKLRRRSLVKGYFWKILVFLGMSFTSFACSQAADLCEVGELDCACFNTGACSGDLLCSSGTCVVADDNIVVYAAEDSGFIFIDSGEPTSVHDAGVIDDSGSNVEEIDSGFPAETSFCTPADLETSFENPTNLGLITDKDDQGGRVLETLDGSADQDWYKYLGQDDFFAYTDPFVKIIASKKVELCMYIACPSADATSFSCPEETVSEVSEFLYSGCCVEAERAEIHIEDLDCGGDENAEVYLLVKDSSVDMCVNYQLEYNY